MRKEPWVYWLIALVLGATVVFVVVDLAGGVGGFEPDWRWVGVVWMVALGVWVVPQFWPQYAGRPGRLLQSIAIWLGIALVFALIYAFRHELGLPIN